MGQLLYLGLVHRLGTGRVGLQTVPVFSSTRCGQAPKYMYLALTSLSDRLSVCLCLSVCLFLVYLVSVHMGFMPDTRNTYMHNAS